MILQYQEPTPLRAQEAYAKQLRKLTEDRTGEKALIKLAEIRTGKKVTYPALADLPKLWAALPRRKEPEERYAGQCRVRLERFAAFVAEKQPRAREFIEVKEETARAFMDSESARGVSPKTWNDTLKLLRATFKHLHPHLSDGSNPFHGLVTKATQTINREPFTVEELKAITEACAQDDFIRPIITTGMCTAMRRGDCCELKWQDVDLEHGFITVKTAKTGQKVDIPIFPLLKEELERTRKGKSPYCFPKQAEMYANNPDGITWRVKQVLAKALRWAHAPKALPEVSPEEVRCRGLEYLDGLEESPRAEKMRSVFTAYANGKGLKEVMRETGCSRGSVSGYLNEIEREIGCPVVRGKRRALNTDELQSSRQNGQRKVSVHDFHSFRVTWITLALAAGVPLELVQRVTGHRTVAVVLKHYFRPGREDFRQAILAAMPKMLGEGSRKSAIEEAREILQGMTAKTWRRDREQLLRLLG
ncbi:MAG: tyrosine-type recombinase/integrase [Verrucomicrobiales bacterium]|nr:tyrosine-type recombinase/integrase [Verrucomicrobiales bacterium]MCP5524871.1 tyrosine-type recombinase/integrase [Verrucomicrobiales bacterium]